MKLREKFSTGHTYFGNTLKEVYEKETSSSVFWRENYTQFRYSALASVPAANLRKNESVICNDLHWSSHNSVLVGFNSDFSIKVYVASDQFESKLVPLKRIFRSNSAIAHDVNPRFDLYDENSYLTQSNNCVISERQLPIKLLSLNLEESDQNPVLSYYEFIDDNNDRYFDSYSLKYLDSSRFVAGTKDKIALFNLDNKNAIETRSVNIGGLGKFGLVSALQCEPDSQTLLIGSYSNNFLSIDLRSQGVTGFQSLSEISGDGIYQILTSDNYAYTLARKTNLIPILERRMGYKCVDYLSGWQADSSLSSITYQKCFGDTNADIGLVVGNQNGEIVTWPKANIGVGGDPQKSIFCKTPICSAKINDEKLLAVSQGQRVQECELAENCIKVMDIALD